MSVLQSPEFERERVAPVDNGISATQWLKDWDKLVLGKEDAPVATEPLTAAETAALDQIEAGLNAGETALEPEVPVITAESPAAMPTIAVNLGHVAARASSERKTDTHERRSRISRVAAPLTLAFAVFAGAITLTSRDAEPAAADEVTTSAANTEIDRDRLEILSGRNNNVNPEQQKKIDSQFSAIMEKVGLNKTNSRQITDDREVYKGPYESTEHSINGNHYTGDHTRKGSFEHSVDILAAKGSFTVTQAEVARESLMYALSYNDAIPVEARQTLLNDIKSGKFQDLQTRTYEVHGKVKYHDMTFNNDGKFDRDPLVTRGENDVVHITVITINGKPYAIERVFRDDCGGALTQNAASVEIIEEAENTSTTEKKTTTTTTATTRGTTASTAGTTAPPTTTPVTTTPTSGTTASTAPSSSTSGSTTTQTTNPPSTTPQTTAPPTTHGPTSTDTTHGPTSTDTTHGPTSTDTTQGPTSTDTTHGPTSSNTTHPPTTRPTTTQSSTSVSAKPSRPLPSNGDTSPGDPRQPAGTGPANSVRDPGYGTNESRPPSEVPTTPTTLKSTTTVTKLASQVTRITGVTVVSAPPSMPPTSFNLDTTPLTGMPN